MAWRFVWLLVGPDLRWRARRFAVTTVGVALLFSVTLLLTGFAEGFTLELDRLQKLFGGDSYVLDESASGPLTSFVPFPESRIDEILAQPEVSGAYPLLALTTSIIRDDGKVEAPVIGHRLGDIEGMDMAEGRPVGGPGEMVIDESADAFDVGETVVVGDRQFEIVGKSARTSLTFGPTAYISLEDAQEAFLGGEDLVTSVVVNGELSDVPDGLRAQTPADMKADLKVRTDSASTQIVTFQVMLWILAFIIVAAVLYLAALERVRDFAVVKAVGARTRYVVTALALEAGLLTLVAALVAIVLANLLAPFQQALISLPASAIWPFPVIALVVGVAGSAAGARKAVTVDPASAFGGP